jgi:hypothetical protein
VWRCVRGGFKGAGAVSFELEEVFAALSPGGQDDSLLLDSTPFEVRTLAARQSAAAII